MWKPIIKNSVLLHAVQEKIELISESIKDFNNDNCSLLGGQAGIVLFKSYYYKYNPKTDINCDLNIEILYKYFESPTSLNFSYGIAGILHSLYHLEKECFFDFGNDIKTFEYSIFEDYISNEMTLDYLHGNTGVILSLLEQNIDKKYNYLFDNWISTIENKKEFDNNNLKWKISLMGKNNSYTNGYCFGLSHGVPSIIIILIKLHKRNKSKRILNYIEQSINFLMENKFQNDNQFYFPTTVKNNVKQEGTLAWCYGDLGVALSLYTFGDYLNNVEFKSFAIEILNKNSLKRDLLAYNIIDADFCHGTIGIAHIYARMYNYTQIELFRETSEYWYLKTIEKACYIDGLAGFKHNNHANGLINEYGLLEGISGIGLSLISSISNIEPKWDNTFLLS